MHLISVVNKKRGGVGEYIGRPSALQNNYTSKDYGGGKRVATVAESIACFERELRDKIARKDPVVCGELNRLYALAQTQPINLVCWCAPGPCHGDVVKKVLMEAHAAMQARAAQ